MTSSRDENVDRIHVADNGENDQNDDKDPQGDLLRFTEPAVTVTNIAVGMEHSVREDNRQKAEGDAIR